MLLGLKLIAWNRIRRLIYSCDKILLNYGKKGTTGSITFSKLSNLFDGKSKRLKEWNLDMKTGALFTKTVKY